MSPACPAEYASEYYESCQTLHVSSRARRRHTVKVCENIDCDSPKTLTLFQKADEKQHASDAVDYEAGCSVLECEPGTLNMSRPWAQNGSENRFHV